MTTDALARSYLFKAGSRLKVLPVLMADENYSDVVREAQELVELALKALLRDYGIEPMKVHDVGPQLVEHQNRFPASFRSSIARICDESRWLRKEREFAFYGDLDVIPSEQYTKADAERAVFAARLTYEEVAEAFSDG